LKIYNSPSKKRGQGRTKVVKKKIKTASETSKKKIPRKTWGMFRKEKERRASLPRG